MSMSSIVVVLVAGFWARHLLSAIVDSFPEAQDAPLGALLTVVFIYGVALLGTFYTVGYVVFRSAQIAGIV